MARNAVKSKVEGVLHNDGVCLSEKIGRDKSQRQPTTAYISPMGVCCMLDANNTKEPENLKSTEEIRHNTSDSLSPKFLLNLKIGIMKDLHKQQLITQKQMELAIHRLKRGVQT